MNANIITFDQTRKPANRVIAAAKAKDAEANAGNKVVSMADWKTRSRARRTARGVFFTTGVLLTHGTSA